jgi:predicted DsbA family dithiol-disulfide isomerase
VPTFVLADRLVIQGAQKYPVFKNAMERLGAQPRAKS